MTDNPQLTTPPNEAERETYRWITRPELNQAVEGVRLILMRGTYKARPAAFICAYHEATGEVHPLAKLIDPDDLPLMTDYQGKPPEIESPAKESGAAGEPQDQ
jgi:hypothetical protein